MSPSPRTQQTPRDSRLRRRTYEIVEVAAPGDRLSRIFDVAITLLIIANVATLVLETVESIHRSAPGFFHWFELVSVGVFTVEYVARLWSCTVDPRYAHPISGRLRFARTPMSVIDLVAVLPFYLPFLGVDLRVVWILRLFRLLRVAKLQRYSRALQTFSRVLRSRAEPLIVSLGFVLALLLISASLMYFAEHDAQPQRFSSIPAAMWWAVETLSTVGYGDFTPVTPLGRMLAGVVAILGIGMFAIPTGILGAAFLEDQQKQDAKKPCPHCGKVAE